jgi:colicin import membrane protein
MNMRQLLALSICLMAAAALADPVHERIASERAAAIAKFTAQDKECRTRFVVASCVEAAQKEEHLTLGRLRQEELRLDDAKRREAAAARRQAVQEKSDAQQSRASEPAPAPLSAHVRHAPNPPSGSGLASPHAELAASSPAERAEFEHSHEAKFDAKAREIEAHRQDVERRNAQRQAQGKTAAPLPDSTGAAASPASAPK